MVLEQIQTAGIVMRRDGEIATIITDGRRVATYESTGRTLWCSMVRAIAHLECKGYTIDMEEYIN